MSILKQFKQDADVENQGDVLGGRTLLESGAYEGCLKMAYITKSKNGAHGIVLELETDKGTHQETVWFTNREGQTYYKDKQGAKKALPGYTTLLELAYLATGGKKSFHELDTEEKIVKVYDFDAQKDVPTEVEVLTELLDIKLVWGITKVKEFKTQQNDDGEYVPTDEIRESNTINKVFSEEGFTKTELMEGLEEPEFIYKWKDRHDGKDVDKTKGVTPKAASKQAPKPSGKSLLGKKK